MSVTYYNYLYVGFSVKKKELLAPGDISQFCPNDEGHKATEYGGFCPVCGTKLRTIREAQPTEAFKALKDFLGELGTFDDQFWTALSERGLGPHGLQFVSVLPLQSSDGRDSERVMALAVKLAKIDSEMGTAQPVPMSELDKEITYLTECCQKIFTGEPREICLYPILYCSC